MSEVWKSVPGFADYEVSNLGRLRSLKKTNRLGLPQIVKQFITAPRKNKPRYWVTRLWNDYGTRKHVRVHRLVLLAFEGPAPAGKNQGAHLDGNSLNNWLANLKWSSQSENEKHKRLHGTVAECSRNGGAKLTDSQVQEIMDVKVWKLGMIAAFAKRFKVDRSTISRVKNGVSWRNF